MRKSLYIGVLAVVLGGAQGHAAGYDDFAAGVSALNRGDTDMAIARLSAALADGDLNAALVPEAYYDRARAYLGKRNCAAAVADLDSAIKLKPAYPAVFIARGAAHWCLNDLNAAIADYSSAIALRPDANLYAGRGRLHWEKAEFADAAADYGQSVKLKPKIVYYVLWLELSRLRAGTLDASAAQSDIEPLDLDGWPKPVFELFLGKASPESVMQSAAKADATAVTGQTCEANFYTAEWRLAQHDMESAKPLLQAAIDQCPKNFVEYSAARVELGRLK